MMSFIAWIGVILLQFLALVSAFGSGEEDAKNGGGQGEIWWALVFSAIAIICAVGIGHADV